MKTAKKILSVLLTVVILLPVLLYAGIVITNNCLADKIETDLRAFPTPDETEVIASLSAAGKLSGNGNGMQYLGAILVKSDLSAEELEAYYDKSFHNVMVREQRSSETVFTDKLMRPIRFSAEPDWRNGTYYSITCFDDIRREAFGKAIENLLDFDIRAH